MTACRLQVRDPVTREGSAELSAVLRTPDLGEQRLWLAVDERHREELIHSADPFVLAALRATVARGGSLRIEGAPASPTLLGNLEELQLAWRQWHGTELVELVSGEEDEPRRERDGALAAFSGGIDSSYTLYRHVTGRARHAAVRLRAAVFVHGFDIPLDDVSGFAGASTRAQRMTDSLGLELITLRTNIRPLNHPWPQFHGPAIAAALAALSRRSSAGLIAASGSYAPLMVPYGSDPVSDPLLGSESFPIRHDGTGATRLQKLEVLASWPEAMRWMRICWQSQIRDRNCGECRKCISAALMCRTLGVTPHFFDDPISDEAQMAVAETVPTEAFSAEYRRLAVEEAERRGMDEPWVRASRRTLRRYRLQRAWTELWEALEPDNAIGRRLRSFAMLLRRRYRRGRRGTRRLLRRWPRRFSR